MHLLIIGALFLCTIFNKKCFMQCKILKQLNSHTKVLFFRISLLISKFKKKKLCAHNALSSCKYAR